MITEKEFKEMVGFAPENDDLDRANCDKAGEIGHMFCGICDKHKKPRFICGCLIKKNK